MAVIEVTNLIKSFKTKLKEEGFRGTIKSIFSPKYKTISAVNNISFSVEEGELVAFIGPNGAGKSTTLKILSGILYPDSGNIKVLGKSPSQERKKLSLEIGTVFGQKPQLWFHLPAIDSFNLFSKIYGLDEKSYNKRLNELVDRFEIREYMTQPVRKLSLGQRMRCEIVLSLLHNPKVLFLDEPTIGLDVLAKKSIRELIRTINEKEKVTVLLTSHDMGDIEKICNRAIIINKGKIIFNGELCSLKQNSLTKKTIRAVSETPIVFREEQGAKILEKSKYEIKIEVDTKIKQASIILEKLLGKNEILDINIEDPPIEEIIENIYSR